MPSFRDHPADVVEIPIGGERYRFRLTLGSLRRFAQREDVDATGVPADQEAAEDLAAAARRTGKLDGLVETLWVARQPFRQAGETQEDMEDAITPPDFGAVLRGYTELMNVQMDAGDLKEKAEEFSRAAEEARGENESAEEDGGGTKKKTSSPTSSKLRDS